MTKLYIFLRLVWLLSAISAFAFLGVGVFLQYRSADGNAPERVLHLELQGTSLCDLPPGAEIPVDFIVTNRSNRPVKLLGSAGICKPLWHDYCVGFPVPGPSLEGEDDCVAWISAPGFPIWIAPGVSCEIPMRLRARASAPTGEFAGSVVLYSDAPGCEQVSLRINGRVVSSNPALIELVCLRLGSEASADLITFLPVSLTEVSK